MRAFLSIVKLTFYQASRSHIFRLLVLFLFLGVALVPSVVSGDGTAEGFIRVALLYSLSAVTLILALSAIWVSCFIMAQDVEGYQLHMVVTKPVSRWLIWGAKFSSVVLMHGVLLLLACTGIYFIIMAQFSRQDFMEEAKQRIRNEMLLGRRVYSPDPVNFDQIAQRKAFRRLQELAAEGKNVEITEDMQKMFLKEMRNSAIIDTAKVEYGETRDWVFSHVPYGSDDVLYLRYRAYVNKVDTRDQRMTNGVWRIGIVQYAPAKPGEGIDPATAQLVSSIPLARVLKSGEFQEEPLGPSNRFTMPNGQIYLSYFNADEGEMNAKGEIKHAAQYFVPTDGPKLLIRVTGFAANFYRGVLVIFLELIILAGLACAAASILSMPTAIFASVAYLIFGSIGKYLTDVGISGGIGTGAVYLSKALLLFVIPLQDFGVTDLLGKGELIEFSKIGTLLLYYISYRALPIFAIGALMYRNRELGLVVRK